MTLDHAMFFLLLLQYDRNSELLRRVGVPEDNMCWPAIGSSTQVVPPVARHEQINVPSEQDALPQEAESNDKFFYDSASFDSDFNSDSDDDKIGSC